MMSVALVRGLPKAAQSSELFVAFAEFTHPQRKLIVCKFTFSSPRRLKGVELMRSVACRIPALSPFRTRKATAYPRAAKNKFSAILLSAESESFERANFL